MPYMLGLAELEERADVVLALLLRLGLHLSLFLFLNVLSWWWVGGSECFLKYFYHGGGMGDGEVCIVIFLLSWWWDGGSDTLSRWINHTHTP